MANCPYLKQGLEELKSIPNIELGLHYNLTYGRPSQEGPNLSCSLIEQKGAHPGSLIGSPGRFLLQWIRPGADRKAHRDHVRAELQSQLETLKHCGVQVQYLDGHHHIHLVPGLMDAVADIILKAGIKRVRLPYDPSLWKSTKAPLALLALMARSRLIQHGFESLPCIYPNEKDFHDPGKLRARLARSPKSEVIVHPAEINDLGDLEFPDTYTQGRLIEYRALKMLGFPS
jgi:predicted glycoside hydrolase/deacetylase ChbG (UPF0249 family)